MDKIEQTIARVDALNLWSDTADGSETERTADEREALEIGEASGYSGGELSFARLTFMGDN